MNTAVENAPGMRSTMMLRTIVTGRRARTAATFQNSTRIFVPEKCSARCRATERAMSDSSSTSAHSSDAPMWSHDTTHARVAELVQYVMGFFVL